MKIAALIVAAGRGLRSGLDVPKQYALLSGRPVLERTMQAFIGHSRISRVVCVIHSDDCGRYDSIVAAVSSPKLAAPAIGGSTRQASVRAGLDALAGHNLDLVLIHDAARPFVSAALIDRAIVAGAEFGAAVPALPLTDAIVRVARDRIATDLPRDGVQSVQTPQSFRYDLIAAAHAAAADLPRSFADDGAVAAAQSHPVHVFEGDADNFKITNPADLERATQRLETRMLTRVATGFDVHAFGAGQQVWLGGVSIPHAFGLIGHSDADVLLHAITDALLGVTGNGDIGVHFPPTDERWRGASSDRFVTFALERLRRRGGIVDHIDTTIVCEAPKISPHRDTIRARIAALCGISINSVALKATTSEGLGFTGRREGIAAFATVTARLPA